MPAPPPPRPLVQTPGVLRWSPSVLRGPRPSQRPCSLDIVNSRPSLVYSNQSTPCTVSTVQCKLIQPLHCIQCTVSSALYPVQAHPNLVLYPLSSASSSSPATLGLQCAGQFSPVAQFAIPVLEYCPLLPRTAATSGTVCYYCLLLIWWLTVI